MIIEATSNPNKWLVLDMSDSSKFVFKSEFTVHKSILLIIHNQSVILFETIKYPLKLISETEWNETSKKNPDLQPYSF
jgi:hypothetical protein